MKNKCLAYRTDFRSTTGKFGTEVQGGAGKLKAGNQPVKMRLAQTEVCTYYTDVCTSHNRCFPAASREIMFAAPIVGFIRGQFARTTISHFCHSEKWGGQKALLAPHFEKWGAWPPLAPPFPTLMISGIIPLSFRTCGASRRLI